jgi:hypothetical protein
MHTNERADDHIFAEQVIAHAALNRGSCHRGFMKDLVDGAAKVA